MDTTCTQAGTGQDPAFAVILQAREPLSKSGRGGGGDDEGGQGVSPDCSQDDVILRPSLSGYYTE